MMTSYSLELSFIRFFNKVSNNRQEKKEGKSKVQKSEYFKSERIFFGKLKAFLRLHVTQSAIQLPFFLFFFSYS